jgi:hypothetical protein
VQKYAQGTWDPHNMVLSLGKWIEDQSLNRPVGTGNQAPSVEFQGATKKEFLPGVTGESISGGIASVVSSMAMGGPIGAARMMGLKALATGLGALPEVAGALMTAESAWENVIETDGSPYKANAVFIGELPISFLSGKFFGLIPMLKEEMHLGAEIVPKTLWQTVTTAMGKRGLKAGTEEFLQESTEQLGQDLLNKFWGADTQVDPESGNLRDMTWKEVYVNAFDQAAADFLNKKVEFAPPVLDPYEPPVA